MKFTVTQNARELKIHFDEAYGHQTLEIDGQPHRLTLLDAHGDRVRFTIDDHPVEAIFRGTPPDLIVDIGKGPIPLRVEESRYAEIRKVAGLKVADKRIADLKAPMPGLITRILVAPGDEVHAGEALLVMEAMKMENELRSVGQGRVREIKVAPKQPVEQGQVLITFE
jgi:biotin carboxyl carrier protein